MKLFLLKLHWFSCQIGFDFLKFFKSMKGLPKYLSDYIKFKSNNNSVITFKPCLTDYFDESGDINSEYFWQDLLISQMIYKNNPKRHIDIGSRIDGFVAHVASYRIIDVFDIRPIHTKIPNVNFYQADLMSDNSNFHNSCDSLSCLHTIEHFGLGRYGDKINNKGYISGLQNITKLISPGGKFYLSTPVGKEKVEFNANWIFNPVRIVEIVKKQGLYLSEFYIIKNGNEFLKIEIHDIEKLSNERYNLGIFIFIKNES